MGTEPQDSIGAVQRNEPPRTWVHTHRFEADDGGTSVSDDVEYELPLGPLGRMAHSLVVRRDLERIFAYRRARIAEIFSPREVYLALRVLARAVGLGPNAA